MARTIVPAVKGPGLVISNLPYGRRVGEESELADLYRRFGASLRRSFGGWRAALLVADPARLVEAFGLEPRARHRLVNGGVDCELLLFGL